MSRAHGKYITLGSAPQTHCIRRKHDEQSTRIECGFTALIAHDHMPTYHIPNK